MKKHMKLFLNFNQDSRYQTGIDIQNGNRGAEVWMNMIQMMGKKTATEWLNYYSWYKDNGNRIMVP